MAVAAIKGAYETFLGDIWRISVYVFAAAGFHVRPRCRLSSMLFIACPRRCGRWGLIDVVSIGYHRPPGSAPARPSSGERGALGVDARSRGPMSRGRRNIRRFYEAPPASRCSLRPPDFDGGRRLHASDMFQRLRRRRSSSPCEFRLLSNFACASFRR